MDLLYVITYYDHRSTVTRDREEALIAMGYSSDEEEFKDTGPILTQAEESPDTPFYYEPADTWVSAIPSESPVVVVGEDRVESRVATIYRTEGVNVISMSDLNQLYLKEGFISEDEVISEGSSYLADLEALPAASRPGAETASLRYEIEDLQELIKEAEKQKGS